jgi:hypothetical protein
MYLSLTVLLLGKVLVGGSVVEKVVLENIYFEFKIWAHFEKSLATNSRTVAKRSSAKPIFNNISML